ANQGHLIIFITHKLSEVVGLADRATILRKGIVVFDGSLQGLTQVEIARLMVGDGDAEVVPAEPARTDGRLVPDLIVADLKQISERDRRGKQVLHNLSLRIQRGQITGIAGASGGGQTELADLIAGLRPPQQGSLRFTAARVVRRY